MSESLPSVPSVLRPGQLPILPLNRDETAPWVFISYSQTQDTTGVHKDWVSKLGRKFGKLGINVTIDNNFDGHESFSEFMDQITQNRFVICVCSSSYVEKSRHPENRTGVIWELEQLCSRARQKQPFASFLIPIIKDGSSAQYPDNIPKLISDHDVLCHNFETEDTAKESFSKIIARIFDARQKISNLLRDAQQYRKYGQELSDRFANAVANYWTADPESREEDSLSFRITSGAIFEIPQEPIEIPHKNNFNLRHREKAVITIGRLDTTYKGDNEILSMLTGDCNDE